MGKKSIADLHKKQPLQDLLLEDAAIFQSKTVDLRWFHPAVNREEAERILLKGPYREGHFLVRDSVSRPDEYVLSCLQDGSPHHYVIQHVGHATYSLQNGTQIYGLDEFIGSYKKSAGDLPCKLTTHCPGQLPPPLSCKFGYTNILHQATTEQNSTIATKILKETHCPDINQKDENGNTALHLASQRGLGTIVWQLLDHGASVEARDAYGCTALSQACTANKAGVISILVRKGEADVQAPCLTNGNVPMHDAAIKGNAECLKMLLSVNAPCWPRNDNKKFPYDLAQDAGHQQCASILCNYQVPPAKTWRGDWYHPKIDRHASAEMLRSHGSKDGLFLVRQSSKHADRYVLSMTSGGNTYNFEIQTFVHQSKTAFYIDDGPLLESLEHLIQHYCLFPDGLPCKLKYAITPACNVKEMNLRLLSDEEALYIQGPQSGKHKLDGRISPRPPDSRPSSRPPIPPPQVNKPAPSSTPPPPPTSSRPTQRGTYNRTMSQPGGRGADVQQPSETEATPIMLDPKTVQLGYEIGQGEYGYVYRGTWKPKRGQKIEVAIKTLNEDHMNQGKEEFLREARVMMKLDHPCIVKLIGICEGPPVMLVQELVQQGSLLDYLLDYPERIKVPDDLYLWAAQVANGMMYLEKQRFVHRDLATRNILVSSRTQVKVGDFGLSRAIGSGKDYYKASVGGRWPLKWYAPESMNYGNFSSASDVWSYGVTLWEMFSMGDKPYGDKPGAQVFAMIERGERLERPGRCPDKVYAVMRQCWAYDPNQRPTFSQLCDHFSADPDYGTIHVERAMSGIRVSSP